MFPCACEPGKCPAENKLKEMEKELSGIIEEIEGN